MSRSFATFGRVRPGLSSTQSRKCPERELSRAPAGNFLPCVGRASSCYEMRAKMPGLVSAIVPVKVTFAGGDHEVAPRFMPKPPACCVAAL